MGLLNLFSKKKQEEKTVYVTGCELVCIKDKCPKFVKMYQHIKNEDGTVKTVEDGRCYAAWIPQLMIEQTTRIIEAINGNKNQK